MKTKKNILFLLLVLILIGANFSPFSCNSDIIGNVTYWDDTPIAGARVRIKELDDYTTTTKADGEYLFMDVPYGDYTIEVSSEGYTTVEKPVNTSYFNNSLSCMDIDGDIMLYLPWFLKDSGTENILMDVYFVDNNIGWIAGYNGTLLKTIDGGETWLAQDCGTTDDIHSVCQSDNNTVWVLAEIEDVYYSSDAGNNWIKHAYEPCSCALNHVQFLDANTGWIASIGTVNKTTNGGDTWNEYFHEVGPPHRFQFIDENEGWGHTGAKHEAVIHTTDGGITWEVQYIDEFMNSVFFVDSNNGWAVGFNGKIIHSTNGGDSWQDQNSGVNLELRDVHFVDVNIGWICGHNGTILSTTDGGVNWKLEPPVVGDNLYDLYFYDSNTGWIVGDLGIIIEYTPLITATGF